MQSSLANRSKVIRENVRDNLAPVTKKSRNSSTAEQELRFGIGLTDILFERINLGQGANRYLQSGLLA
jgi:hypothetical protein